MWTYNYQYPNELYHHGVKGMKWGVRRYQNEDGSLTSAGKRRYSYNSVTVGEPNKEGMRTVTAKNGKSISVHKDVISQLELKEYMQLVLMYKQRYGGSTLEQIENHMARNPRTTEAVNRYMDEVMEENLTTAIINANKHKR